MAKRGRKPKVKLDIEAQLDEALEKYLSKMPLTLEETALLIWQKEGRPTKEPLSKARIKAIENTALAKLKLGLEKCGITKLSDVLDINKTRAAAKCYDRVADVEQ